MNILYILCTIYTIHTTIYVHNVYDTVFNNARGMEDGEEIGCSSQIGYLERFKSKTKFKPETRPSSGNRIFLSS